MRIQTIEVEKTEPCRVPVANSEEVVQISSTLKIFDHARESDVSSGSGTDSQAQVDHEVRSKMLSVGWWLPCLIRGWVGFLFFCLGVFWLRDTVLAPDGDKSLKGFSILLVLVLSIASSNYVGKVVCKMIRMKEIW